MQHSESLKFRTLKFWAALKISAVCATNHVQLNAAKWDAACWASLEIVTGSNAVAAAAASNVVVAAYNTNE